MRTIEKVRAMLPTWPPADEADDVQRVRNLLCVAGVPDAIQQPAERIVPYVDMPEGVRVFTHIDAKPDQVKCDLPVVLKETPAVRNPHGWDVLTFKFAPKQ